MVRYLINVIKIKEIFVSLSFGGSVREWFVPAHSVTFPHARHSVWKSGCLHTMVGKIVLISLKFGGDLEFVYYLLEKFLG